MFLISFWIISLHFVTVGFGIKKQTIKLCFYQVRPRSFNNSIGEEIGGLNGVTQSLDELVDLGIDVIWLLLCYRIPTRDGAVIDRKKRNRVTLFR